MATHDIQTQRLSANGLRFTARTCGEGPLVLCLHGFPDSAHTYDDLLPRLADAGYRAVAPFMRGYAPTQVPVRGDYSPATLGRDVLGLADALRARRFRVIGHDWGAVAAYAAAAFAPARVERLMTAAVPPLRRFLLNMNPAQVRRSWYMGFFQLPWLSEARLARDECALVERLWRDWSPGWDFGADDIAPVKAILSHAPSRRAALRYYRSLPAAILSPRRGPDRRRTLGRMAAAPALVVAGTGDGCIGSEMFAGTEDCFTGDCRLAHLDAGHFMHREVPAQFTRLAVDFLA